MVPAMFELECYADSMIAAYYDYYTSVSLSYGIVVSAIHTEALPAFASRMKTIVNEHSDEMKAACTTGLGMLNYFKYGSRTSGGWGLTKPDYYDIKSVLHETLDGSNDEDIYALLDRVVTCRHADTWYSAFNNQMNPIEESQCSGMTMFVPQSKYNNSSYPYNEYFLATQWAKDVWTESNNDE
jgi:hypothetical protein